jgi:glycosyltransferase involved in cell wall biosynthesis
VEENESMDISIVIPVFNESKSIRPLCEAIVASLEPLPYTFEVLLIDDGSADDTFSRARDIALRDSRFRVFRFTRNFGQTAALNAGFEHAQGEMIVTMDGDLQNDPRDIGRFIEKLEEGYDVVLGWRADRKDRFVSRKLPSRIANWLIRKVAGTSIKDNGCALRAYRASVIKKFPLYSEMHRLLPTILSLAGVQMTQIKVRHHSRQFGESKYGLARTYRVLFDLMALKTVMTSARLPLFGFGSLAVISGVACAIFLYGAMAQYILLPGSSIVVYTGVSMLWGALSVSLIMLGILCSLIYAKGRFKVDDILRIETL